MCGYDKACVIGFVIEDDRWGGRALIGCVKRWIGCDRGWIGCNRRRIGCDRAWIGCDRS